MYTMQDKFGNIEGVYNINAMLLRLLSMSIQHVTRPRRDALALPDAGDEAMFAIIQDSKDALWGQKTPLYKCFAELAKIEVALARVKPPPPTAPDPQEPVLSDHDVALVQHYIAQCKEQDLHRMI